MADREGGRGGGSLHVQPGTRLSGIYEIDELIATGGMGEVFKGHNIETADLVAIKIVLPEFARDKLIIDLFRKEARILNQLSHEAIVRYHIFAIDPEVGRPYLAMEYVGGPSLAERIRSGPLAIEDVVLLQKRLADGLQKAHEAGVIHRDMSPDNVILSDGRVDRAKIIDFGIAKSAKDATLIGGSFAGKYSFVSPEQLGLFGGEVTAKSDIYSLGLVLAAALNGRPLDMSGSQVEVIEKRRVVPPLPDVDPRMLALLRAMLQPDPADRPASMAVVRDWITATDHSNLRSEPTRLAPIRPTTIPPSIPTRPPPPRSTRRREAPKSRGGLGFLLALLFVAVIGAGAFGGWYYVEYGRLWQPGGDGSEVVETPPVPTTRPEMIAAFAQGFDGGQCFAAFPSPPDSEAVAVLARNAEPLERMLAAFRSQHGFAPQAELKIVSQDQCAAVEALRKLNAGKEPKPEIQVEKEQLAGNTRYPGGAVRFRGSVSNLQGRNLAVLFIDNKGAINDLMKVLKKVGDSFTFQEIHGLAEASSTDTPLLILIIAYSGPTDKVSSLVQAHGNINALMPPLLQELEGQPGVAAAIEQLVKAPD